MKPIDINNNKYLNLKVNSWKILSFSHRDDKWKQLFFICQCDCGTIKPVQIYQVISSRSKSCGCVGRLNTSKRMKNNKPKNTLPYGQSSLNRLYNRYKWTAKKRGYDFTLSKKELEFLVQQNCHYCNEPPSQNGHDRRDNGYVVYNGIDRKNNNLSYIYENCLTCCGICNRAKHKMSYESFTAWLNKLRLPK